jgi:hypothetical protein
MAAFLNFLFGQGPLKKAATTGNPAQVPPPPSKGDAGLDIAGMAQQQANAALKQRALANLHTNAAAQHASSAAAASAQGAPIQNDD